MHVVDFTTLDLQRIPPYHFLHSHNHPLIQKSVQTHHTAKAAPSRYPLSSASRQANNYHQNTPKNYQQNTPPPRPPPPPPTTPTPPMTLLPLPPLLLLWYSDTLRLWYYTYYESNDTVFALVLCCVCILSTLAFPFCPPSSFSLLENFNDPSQSLLVHSPRFKAPKEQDQKTTGQPQHDR